LAHGSLQITEAHPYDLGVRSAIIIASALS